MPSATLACINVGVLVLVLGLGVHSRLSCGAPLDVDWLWSVLAQVLDRERVVGAKHL
jgi:hypothetical protein